MDIKTDETLALYVDYSTSHERRQAGWSGWKFWLASDDCIGGQDKAIHFVKFVEHFFSFFFRFSLHNLRHH